MTVVLIDTYTRQSSKLAYDVISKHAAIVTDPSEVGEMHQGADFIFFEPAVGVVLTPDHLEQMIDSYKLKPTLVYREDKSLALFDERTYGIKADYSKIDWTFIYAVCTKDQAILEAYQASRDAIDVAGNFLSKLPKDMEMPMERLYSTACSLAVRYNSIVEENTKLKEAARVQSSVTKKSRDAIEELAKLLEESQSACHGYEALLSKSYDQTFGGFYPERPKVLYIKTISHVSGINTLLTLLQTVITRQYLSSCKVVKLVDSHASKTLRYTPMSYKRITDVYDSTAILHSDFIVKLGAYHELFDLLMTNRSGLDYLIVHDERDAFKPALDKPLVDLYLNEVSSDFATLAEYDNILSDFGSNIPYVWNFAEVSKYSGTDSIKLTGHPTVASILGDLMG